MMDLREVGKADSYKLISGGMGGGFGIGGGQKDPEQFSFSNSLNRIMSESSNTHNSNHLIGGGLLGGGSFGRSGALQEMLTPNAGSNMTESPIFATSFGNRHGGRLKPSLALQKSLSSQQSDELKLLGQFGKQGGMRRLDEELREEELHVDDDERAGIILPLDCKKQHHNGSDPISPFFNDDGDFIMD